MTHIVNPEILSSVSLATLAAHITVYNSGLKCDGHA